MSWKKIICNNQEVQLTGTLNGGQSFSILSDLNGHSKEKIEKLGRKWRRPSPKWTPSSNKKEWVGTFSKTVWKLRLKDNNLEYQVLGSLLQNRNKLDNNADIFKAMLRKYFRLDVDLGNFYKEWSQRDELFKSNCKQFYGIRMLWQELVENLFSFICSQNNHITRISTMVEKLCSQYGEEICEYNGAKYFAFPEVEKLSHLTVESQLRELGFGYRAKFIQKSAEQIVEWNGNEWFQKLQDMKYQDARVELMKLHGIGPKVADCICLMSLNHLEAVPVDTHVYQIAAQNYLPHLRGRKSVTEKMYVEIGDHFRSLYGDMAGWAHTVLFCADLKMFQQNEISCDDDSKPKKKRKK